MKKLLFIIFFVLATVVLFAINNTPDQDFKNANNLYAQNEFEKAFVLYEMLISEDYNSSDLFFNAGNTAYRLNKTGLSVYYYEKAKMLKPNDEDINYNLELAKLRVKSLPPEVPKIFPVRIFMQTVMLKSYQFWGLLSLLLFFVFLVFAWFYFISRSSRSKKIRFISALIIFIFSLLSFVFMQYELSLTHSHNQAIVINKEAAAKSSPDTNATDLFKVYEGYKVTLETSNNDWYEIKLTDGKKAWLKKKDLKVL